MAGNVTELHLLGIKLEVNASITINLLLTQCSLLNMQSTNWLFTINNPTSNDIPRTWSDVRYCVWQLEAGENGTPHLQGYVVLEKKKRLGGMKRLDGQAHWETRKGTHVQAKDYCRKELSRVEGPWEIGRDLEPGRRLDLESVAQAVSEGAPVTKFAKESPVVYARYYKGLTALSLAVSRPRKHKTKVTVIWGETGVGKSRWASETYPDAYWKPPNSKWWDNYAQEEVIVIDEFYGWLHYCEMLRLLDRYPCQVETKGGSINFRPMEIIILSNKAPEDWYDKTKCAWEPLERRIENYGQMMPGGHIMWLKQTE